MSKVLYKGCLDPYGTYFSRYNALKKLGINISGFDTDDYLRSPKANRLKIMFEGNLKLGRRLMSVEHALIERVIQTKPDTLWLDAAEWVFPKTLKRIKAKGVFLVHHVTEALKVNNLRTRVRRRLFTKTVPQFDAFLTTIFLQLTCMLNIRHGFIEKGLKNGE